MRRINLFCLLLLSMRISLAQNSIDTLPAWNGTTFISSFGIPNTATYGQTITVPPNTSPLTAFSFQIGNCNNTVTFRGFVYAWDGAKATGPELYASAPQTVTASSAYTQVTFSVPNLTLPAGQYVLFASTSLDYSGAPNGTCRWGSVVDNTTYAGGQFYFQNNGSNFANLSVVNWSTIAQDLAFQVTGLVPGVTGIPAASPFTLGFTFILMAAAGTIMLMRRKEQFTL